MGRYVDYGIDLGTTNSCIARWDGADVRVFQNNDQMNVTPSAIHALRNGRLFVGRKALNASVDDSDNVAREFKRQMGQKFKKVFPASRKEMNAEELSAEILSTLIADAQRQTGDEIRSAVITVPAAFGVLQCEATSRAARLAGLDDAPLLQEPIAAAVAYGVTPGSGDQRFMVFDLGGGTLDIAIISTKDRRLTVLEHRGNNHLGGKDIDRLIVEHIFIPLLLEQFALPDPAADPARYNSLLRRLSIRAEEEKIALSRSEQVQLSLFNLGDDLEGKPIELEMPLSRKQIENQVEAMAAKCIQLAREAIAGARLSERDLDKILLVGGPTQMPFFRKTLTEALGIPVDHSLDPMTIVARGAAIYAATVERTNSSAVVSLGVGQVSAHLEHDPVSATLQCPVAGKVNANGSSRVADINIEAEGGYWVSGWLPVVDGFFDTSVLLREGKTSTFRLSARDAAGRLLEVVPSSFAIRHGATVGAPPLTESICVEVVSADGRPVLDEVFKRSTPLPAERVVKYRARETIKPSDEDKTLAIKLWEGDVFSDPEANKWIGNIHIRAKRLKRPIPEGVIIELTIRVNESRLISVEAWVPHLNEHFSEELYMPDQEPRDAISQFQRVGMEIDTHIERLDNLEHQAESVGNRDVLAETEKLRHLVWDLDAEVNSWSGEAIQADPDRAFRLVDESREIRARLSRLEDGLGVAKQATWTQGAIDAANRAEEVATQFGTEHDKRQFSALKKELEQALALGDIRGVKKAVEGLNDLRWGILTLQDWFWRDLFHDMRRPATRFSNTGEAQRWITHGENSLAEGNSEQVREAVVHLWKLRQPDATTLAKESAMLSGLRRYTR